MVHEWFFQEGPEKCLDRIVSLVAIVISNQGWLSFRGSSNSFGVPFERHQATDLDLPSEDELVAYGEDTFESILKYMVSSGLGTEFSGSRPQPEVLQLLHASGLMTDPWVLFEVSCELTMFNSGDMTGRNPNINRLTITSKGFQFLLEKRQTQLWEILMYYLSAKEVRPYQNDNVLIIRQTLNGHLRSCQCSFPSDVCN